MKTNARWLVALAMISGVCLNTPGNSQAASSKEVEAEAKSMAKRMEDERRAEATARAKNPAWQPSAREAGLIQIGDGNQPGALRNFCLNAEGNILACYAPPQTSSGAKNAPGIRIYSPEGALLKSLPLEIKPTAIAVAKDRSIFVAGDGRLLKLDAAGKVLASTESPTTKEPVVITKEVEEMVKEMVKDSKRSFKQELENMKTNLERRRSEVTGLAVTEQDVFMAVGSPTDFTYRVYRFDHALANPKLAVEKLRGCCGQMDIQAHEAKLWIPHNARHTVECRDREGKELSKFGTKGKVKPADFGGCCEPKNMRVLANGDILAAESGPPTSIKRFSATGKLLEVVAVLDTKGDCVRVTVEMSPDGSRYYLMDTTRDAIRVFKAKG